VETGPRTEPDAEGEFTHGPGAVGRRPGPHCLCGSASPPPDVHGCVLDL